MAKAKPKDMENTFVRVAGLVEESIVDGNGVRYVVFLQGCPIHCDGCQNPETWNQNKGTKMSLKELYDTIHKYAYNKHVTFSGGEPTLQGDKLAILAKQLKEEGFDIWVYSGYYFEEIKDCELLKYCDFLVDGPFVQGQKSLDLVFRGSANQHVIDLNVVRMRSNTQQTTND